MFRDLLDILFPRKCPICGRRLLPDEDCVCLRCLMALPRIHAEHPDNVVEHRVFGRVPYEHGTSFCYYSPQGVVAEVIRRAKYHGMPWLNANLTHIFLRELCLASSLWPYDVDCIVPIPVHWRRRLSRGYNQSMAIAEQLASEWQLPVEDGCLVKSRFTTSQVGLRREERLRHVDDSFCVRHPERLQGRHVLIVDDVLTTGSTIMAASDALRASVPDIRISFLTLVMTSE